ncbi:MAG: hypothetical protein RL208_270 [Pseudomonadota bacterium]|jgi:cytoskeletal protein CcmA (bactofilin family)
MSKQTMSIIDNATIIEGTVKTTETLEIIGSIKGTIIARNVNTKMAAMFEGDILVYDLLVCESGVIKGNIIANKLKIMKNGRIEGKIRYTQLAVEDGAIIDGDIKKISKEEMDNHIAKITANSQEALQQE